MSNRELKLRTNLGNKTKKRQLSEKRSRRARGLRALNLPTTVTGSLKTAENGSLSNDGHKQDVAVIHCLQLQLMPHINRMVQTTYDKMLSYTSTARHFLPRQHGYEGTLPQDLSDLSQEDAQVQFRKEHLRRYLMSLLGNPYDARMTKYLDVVGKIHTPHAGNKQINVPLVQMNALMGLLSDVLTDMIFRLEMDRHEAQMAVRAFGKLLWIQNDLINRHYSGAPQGEPQPKPSQPAPAAWR